MSTPQDFEKLGLFYLGRQVSDENGELTDQLTLYDSKDLTTHAVIVGMTGSGKTGLAVTLIEEAALDHIPVIAIDPKGDLGNLLLTFPQLAPGDFEPWIDPAGAAQAGQSTAEFAAATAAKWRAGLAAWGQGPERIGMLRDAAETVLYTPGSAAGRPLSVLNTLGAPAQALRSDPDSYRELVANVAANLLGLVGIEADPLTSREHILLSAILDAAWQQGQDLDLGKLIARIQHPGFERIGVMPLDSFFAPDDRFALAMRLNALLASPRFRPWLEGEPLDVDKLLYSEQGKPRVAVLHIAHLDEQERMFFVATLLNAVLAWMRKQPGTPALRAIVYMDELYGFMPPVANPPAKRVLLTLLKQARAYGVGIVLATQNPVDLDYKGLSNAGTWFIGRLQTERDRARLVDGLATAAGGATSAAATGAMLAGLGKRRFLLHNVHEPQPTVFETRWAMSYLSGPLTREQVKRLTLAVPAAAAVSRPAGPRNAAAGAPQTDRPVLPPDVRQVVLEPGAPLPAGAPVEYRPALLARVSLVYAQAAKRLHHKRELALLLDVDGNGVADWSRAREIPLTAADRNAEPDAGAAFASCPPPLADAASYKKLAADLKRWLRNDVPLKLYASPALKESSRPEESERDFRIRLQTLANERRDAATTALRARYETKLDRLRERIRRAEQVVERERQQASGQKLDTALSFGTALLGAVLGRRATSLSSASRIGAALRKAGRVRKESGDVKRAEQSAAALEADIAELEARLSDELEALEEKYAAHAEALEETLVRASASDIDVELLALAWVPGTG